MAIIVDKVQKRKDIALSCKEIFLQKGINALTISEIAKSAGVGKGTLYGYFENKEDIVFEIVNILMQKHNEKLLIEIQKEISTKDKIKKLSEFFYNEDEYELREFYKEFVSITLVSPTQNMKDFQTQASTHYYNMLQEIIQNGIDNGELLPESIALSRGLFVVGKGMFIVDNITDSIENLKKELDKFIDAIFKLMEVKS